VGGRKNEAKMRKVGGEIEKRRLAIRGGKEERARGKKRR